MPLYGILPKQKLYGVCVCYACAVVITCAAQLYYEPPVFLDPRKLAERFKALPGTYSGIVISDLIEMWNKQHPHARIVEADQGMLYVLTIRINKHMKSFMELWDHCLMLPNMCTVVCGVRTDNADSTDHAVAACESMILHGERCVFAVNSQVDSVDGRSSVQAHRYKITAFDFASKKEVTECYELLAEFEGLSALCDDCFNMGTTKQAECRRDNYGDPKKHHHLIKEIASYEKYDFYQAMHQCRITVSDEQDQDDQAAAESREGRSKAKASSSATAKKSSGAGLHIKFDPSLSPKKRRVDDQGVAKVAPTFAWSEVSRYEGALGEIRREEQRKAHMRGKEVYMMCECGGVMVGAAMAESSQATLRCKSCPKGKTGVRQGPLGWKWSEQ